jgi:hypothetical protein
VWLATALTLAACGTPGAPSPPSLNLPGRVTNLAATRAGNQVTLTWTMPKKNTDKLLLKSDVAVRVCRKEGAGTCDAAGGELMIAPGAAGSFAETLPAALAAGPPRPASYFVELKNRNGRSAGLSNAAIVLAGAAPAPVAGLSSEIRRDGIALRWTPDSSATAVRLQRRLLTPATTKPKSEQEPLAPTPEPLQQNLLVEVGAQTEQAKALDRALDKDIRFGETYEYRAQRVARMTVDGQTLELDGELSAPVRVEPKDIFPPAVPTGLAAVATAASAGAEASIDLSWQPDTEADLAGYIVYRHETNSVWQRISPPQPLVGPAFHDATVEAGHTYIYAVTGVDQGGHESARSAETQETVPVP